MVSWLGQTTRSISCDGLVITRVPVLIGAGIPLFGPVPRDIRPRHVATRCYHGGLVQSEYEKRRGTETVNKQSRLIPKEVEAHYLETRESERLSGTHGELEQLRTLAILTRALPPVPAVIFDIGGAAGAYAFPLSERGYVVHLIDPVEVHLEQAKARSASSGITLSSITKGDARWLSATSNSADAVLLLGPLYHLVERADRLMALREARRILKTQGVLIAAAISRFASLIDGLARGFFRDAEFRKIIASDLATGQHRNPTNETAYFTTAYFHRPEELAAEVHEAGFADIEIFAVEGPVWSTARLGETWEDPVQRTSLMEFLSLIEREPSAHGASAHILAVAHAS